MYYVQNEKKEEISSYFVKKPVMTLFTKQKLGPQKLGKKKKAFWNKFKKFKTRSLLTKIQNAN